MTREINRSDFNAESFDPNAPDFQQDPYPFYQWFRRYSPVTPVYGNYNSYWGFRYSDINQVLNDPDPDLWSKRDPTPSKAPPLLPNSLFLSDPADEPPHRQLREILEPVLMQAIEDVGSFAGQRARALVQNLREKKEFELVTDYVTPLPSAALAHVLGIPEAAWNASVAPLVNKVVRANDPTIDLIESATGKGAMLALRLQYKALLEAAKLAQSKGLNIDFNPGKIVSRMYALAMAEDSGFGEGDLVANATSITLAGYFSTSFVLSTGIAYLINNPGTLTQLQSAIATGDGPAALHKAVGEMLRHDTPIQIIDRFATKRTTLGGHTVNAGDKVALVIGSGNRDEEVFDDPDSFDIERDTNKKLSFGSGIHRCLGAPMLGKVAPAALAAIVDDLPKLAITGNPVQQTDPYFSGYHSLTLKYQ